MEKKEYIAPAITIVGCDMRNCLLSGSTDTKWDPDSDGDLPPLDIYDEKDGNLDEEITG